MKFKIFNSWIFFICTLSIIVIQNEFIKNKFISIPIYVLAILGIIYSLYTSEINKKIKFINIVVYLLCLIFYLFKYFLY